MQSRTRCRAPVTRSMVPGRRGPTIERTGRLRDGRCEPLDSLALGEDGLVPRADTDWLFGRSVAVVGSPRVDGLQVRMTSSITLAAGLSRTIRNNMDANSYLELGRTGQNGSAQDRVKPPNGAPHRTRRSLHQGVGHRRVLDLDGMAGPRNYVPQLHQSGHRHRRRGRARWWRRHVTIQCKSRRLENGMPAAIQISELALMQNP